MSQVLTFPTKEQSTGPIVIAINGYWNGPLFYFEVSSSAILGDDPRIALTNNFDGAVRAAIEYAQVHGIGNVRFALTSEDMLGGAA